jgi:hypothetical protein
MTKAFDMKRTPKMKLGIVGFRTACPCKSGKEYGKCCFRLELTYLTIVFVAAILLALFVFLAVTTKSPKSFFFAASLVVFVAAAAANFARKHFKKK